MDFDPQHELGDTDPLILLPAAAVAAVVFAAVAVGEGEEEGEGGATAAVVAAAAAAEEEEEIGEVVGAADSDAAVSDPVVTITVTHGGKAHAVAFDAGALKRERALIVCPMRGVVASVGSNFVRSFDSPPFKRTPFNTHIFPPTHTTYKHKQRPGTPAL